MEPGALEPKMSGTHLSFSVCTEGGHPKHSPSGCQDHTSVPSILLGEALACGITRVHAQLERQRSTSHSLYNTFPDR